MSQHRVAVEVSGDGRQIAYVLDVEASSIVATFTCSNAAEFARQAVGVLEGKQGDLFASVPA